MPHRDSTNTSTRPEASIRQRYLRPSWETLLCLLFMLAVMPFAHADIAATYPQVRSLFPSADRFGETEGTPPAAPVYQNDQLIGYAFLTTDMVNIPARASLSTRSRFLPLA
jgi:NosR/NirI family nitrous oxide reductase transcriptional regulator